MNDFLSVNHPSYQRLRYTHKNFYCIILISIKCRRLFPSFNMVSISEIMMEFLFIKAPFYFKIWNVKNKIICLCTILLFIYNIALPFLSSLTKCSLLYQVRSGCRVVNLQILLQNDNVLLALGACVRLELTYAQIFRYASKAIDIPLGFLMHPNLLSNCNNLLFNIFYMF